MTTFDPMELYSSHFLLNPKLEMVIPTHWLHKQNNRNKKPWSPLGLKNQLKVACDFRRDMNILAFRVRMPFAFQQQKVVLYYYNLPNTTS